MNATGKKYILQLDDGSGNMKAQMFADEVDGATLEALLNRYVRVLGRLSAWKGGDRTSFDVDAIRPVDNANEVFFHMTEVMVASQYAAGAFAVRSLCLLMKGRRSGGTELRMF